MACPDYEDRLVQYGELWEVERHAVEVHLAACPACRAYLDTLTRQDAELSAAFAGWRPQLERPAAMLARTGKPSPLPEILDLLAWAALLVVAVGLIHLRL